MSGSDSQPDMLVSPDGQSVDSTGALAEAEIEERLAAGWRRVPFEQFLLETAEATGIEPA